MRRMLLEGICDKWMDLAFNLVRQDVPVAGCVIIIPSRLRLQRRWQYKGDLVDPVAGYYGSPGLV